MFLFSPRWNRFWTARAHRAFPGAMSVRVTKDLDGTYIERSFNFVGWVVYRGLLWEFGGGVKTNPYRAAYGCSAANAGGIYLTTALRLVESYKAVKTLPDAITAVDLVQHTVPDFWSGLPQRHVYSVDALPWEIHGIEDLDARRLAGAAYTVAQV